MSLIGSGLRLFTAAQHAAFPVNMATAGRLPIRFHRILQAQEERDAAQTEASIPD
jgi:hypothetical protein